jgi:hypothetical protein
MYSIRRFFRLISWLGGIADIAAEGAEAEQLEKSDTTETNRSNCSYDGLSATKPAGDEEGFTTAISADFEQGSQETPNRPQDTKTNASRPVTPDIGSAQIETITGDFATLLNLPPPDFSQHPALRENAFEARSNCPLLLTQSTPEQIRQHVRVTNNSTLTAASRATSSGSLLSSAKKKFFCFDVRSPSVTQTEFLEESIRPASPSISRRSSPPKPLDLSKTRSRPGSSASSSTTIEQKRTGVYQAHQTVFHASVAAYILMTLQVVPD